LKREDNKKLVHPPPNPLFRSIPYLPKPPLPSAPAFYPKPAKSSTETIIFVLQLSLMEVNDALIDNLSELARLEFSPEEKAGIRADLQRMIRFVEKLGELDTTGVTPLLHMSSESDVLREDRPQSSISREQALANAPATDGVYFEVPKVIRNPSGT
jgi:aspartyl-tRNA(Asn)/glutamyl-tRNA(Gln) amidotransferase subunit C